MKYIVENLKTGAKETYASMADVPSRHRLNMETASEMGQTVICAGFAFWTEADA